MKVSVLDKADAHGPLLCGGCVRRSSRFLSISEMVRTTKRSGALLRGLSGLGRSQELREGLEMENYWGPFSVSSGFDGKRF